MNLQKKLFCIQKAIKSFDKTEDSAKKAGDRSEYPYTPGWVILQTIREQMDAMGIMLDTDITEEKHDMINRIVYKVVQNTPQPFTVNEVLYTVKVAYRFIDVETGESTETRTMVASGTNGIDKGLATALSTAQRNIFLKYFSIPTKDRSCEADAYDPNMISGLPAEFQGNYEIQQPQYRSQPARPAAPAPQVIPKERLMQTPGQAPAPMAAAPVTSAVTQQLQPQMQTQPQKTQAAATATQPAGDDLYAQCRRNLMNYQAGTAMHNRFLQIYLSQLNRAGYDTSNPDFQTRLINEAQAMREGRAA